MSSDHPVTESNVVSAPDSLVSLDLTGDAIKIDAKLYEVEDADAHLDGVGASGNLNHALLQQQLGAEMAAIDGSVAFDSHQIGSEFNGATAQPFAVSAQLDLGLTEPPGTFVGDAASSGFSSLLPVTGRDIVDLGAASQEVAFAVDAASGFGEHAAGAGGGAFSASGGHDGGSGGGPDVTSVTVIDGGDVTDGSDVTTVDLPDLVGGVVGDVTDVVGDVVGVVGDVVGDVGGVVGDVVGDVVHVVGDLVGDLTGTVGDAVGIVGGIGEELLGAVGDVTCATGEIVHGLTGTVADTVGCLVGSLDGVTCAVGGLTDQAANLGSEAFGIVGGALDGAGHLTGVAGGALAAVGDIAAGLDQGCGPLDGLTQGLVGAGNDVLGLLGSGDGSASCGDTDLTLNAGLVGGEAPIAVLAAEVPLDPVEALVGDIDIEFGAALDATGLTSNGDVPPATADSGLPIDLASQLLSNFDLEMSEAGGCPDGITGAAQGALDWTSSAATESADRLHDLLELGGGALADNGSASGCLPEPDGSVCEGLNTVIDDSLFSHGCFHSVL